MIALYFIQIQYFFFFIPWNRYSTKPTDVYITEKTNFKVQDEKCQQILDTHGEVILHGLGKALNRTINLALQLQAKSAGTVQICAQTSTVDLTDDFIPESDDAEEMSHDRSNSAIHIRIFRFLDQSQSQESEVLLGKS